MAGRRCELPERGWLPLVGAASYVGLSPNVLRRAIAAGELPAYVKPVTVEGRGSGKSTYVLVSVADIDAWVRSLPRATFGPGRGLTEVA